MDALRELAESVSRLKFPERTDQRIQALMARNSEGLLSEPEREELASLVEVSELLAPVRAEALRILGRRP